MQGELVPHENGRRPNLAAQFVRELAEMLEFEFVTGGRGNLKKTFGPRGPLPLRLCCFPRPELPRALRGVSETGFPAPAAHRPAQAIRPIVPVRRETRGAPLDARATEGLAMPTFPSTCLAATWWRRWCMFLQRGPLPGSERSARGGSPACPRKPRPARRSGPDLVAGPTGRVYINSKQYFDDILPVVWEFRIGGYQVCEKWLKDRRKAGSWNTTTSSITSAR